MEHNKKYKVIKSDTNRLVVRCIHEACLWSIQATCSKKHRMWVISKCNGPHSCTSLEKYVWEDLTRSVKDLRSILHATHGHDVTMYSILHATHGHDVTMYKVWGAKQKAVCVYLQGF